MNSMKQPDGGNVSAVRFGERGSQRAGCVWVKKDVFGLGGRFSHFAPYVCFGIESTGRATVEVDLTPEQAREMARRLTEAAQQSEDVAEQMRQNPTPAVRHSLYGEEQPRGA